MGDNCKPSLRIDWFDGTLINDTGPSTSVSSFTDEEQDVTPPLPKPVITEKKPIGFKRLQDISFLEPPILNLEVSNRPGFWNLFDCEPKGDFIVLLVKVLTKIYHSLEPRDKSKIAGLLKTRFQSSMFINVLKNYVESLPTVRLTEKRMNQQLWDDADAFFTNVIKVCEGIIKFEGHSMEFLVQVLDLVEIIEMSIIGVREEHTETFNDCLFTRILELKSKLHQILQNDSEEFITQSKDPSHFTNLNIFPTKEDLLGQTTLKIKPNIVNGAYKNIDDYLDLQFKLLREDCFGPLREGISKYRENTNKRRHENIRINPKVRIIRIHVSNNRVGHLVDIAWEQRNKTVSKRNVYNKQLMFGSLLLFTNDDFKTILCATVLDSSTSLLSEGYIAVQFQNVVSNKIFTEAYIMVESEVFFEPYHQVLKVLQQSRLDSLPMSKYIVNVQKETEAPKYLSNNTTYSEIDQKSGEEISFPILNTNLWPSNNNLGLDISQMEAYKLALTREFAVIQGPPGTGKTFVGIKIASTILKNLSLEGTPMLVICYTNHALDQFLEGILQTTDSIIRLGSQSKSKILEPYNLNNQRSKIKSKYSYLYVKKKNEIQKIFNEMTDIQDKIENCERNILTYKSIKKYLEINNQKFELSSSKEDPVLTWLFNDDAECQKDDDNDDWENQFEKTNLEEEDLESDNIEECFSEKMVQKEIQSLNYSKKYIEDVTDDEIERQKMVAQFEEAIDKIRKRRDTFRKYWSLFRMEDVKKITQKPKNIYDLKQEHRWKLYFTAVNNLTDGLVVKINELQSQHNICSKELDEVSTLVDGEVIRGARVVGVTTTTAARRHDLMKNLHSPIVIVEEAAEVLEAHIVASLTNHCQHLILIGDHKQLRPTAAHFKLARDYSLEVSLFERMIRNGVHARTLSIQRRMRPNFVQLLVPIIYEKLDSHESVYNYPNVVGMNDSLYFLDHNIFEESEGLEESWSHKNYYEARWTVALANHLRRMKYKTDEVTILTTYTGQASLIRELSKKYESLRNTKITVVDNYQGEESRIVILSLVRSNRDGKIGFLSAANRICVALSRAKEGFYIIGNMGVLKSASNIWWQINENLKMQNAIGNTLKVNCDKHIHEIKNAEDLDLLEDDCSKLLCK